MNGLDKAVGLFNRTLFPSNITVYWNDIGIPSNVVAGVYDVSTQGWLTNAVYSFTTNVPAETCVLLKITSGKTAPVLTPGVTLLTDCPRAAGTTNYSTFTAYSWSQPYTVQPSASVQTLTLGGTNCTNGFFMYAPSTLPFWLGGVSGTFSCDYGRDAVGAGTNEYLVWGDGVKLFDSGPVTNGSAAHLVLSLTNVTVLSLQISNVTDSLNNIGDWVNAQMVVPTTSPTYFQGQALGLTNYGTLIGLTNAGNQLGLNLDGPALFQNVTTNGMTAYLNQGLVSTGRVMMYYNNGNPAFDLESNNTVALDGPNGDHRLLVDSAGTYLYDGQNNKLISFGLNGTIVSNAFTVYGSLSATNFNGNGAGLTNLNASQLVGGTVPDLRLSTNVALLNGSNQTNGVVQFGTPVAIVVTGADSDALSASNNAPAGAGTGIAVYGITSQSSAAGVVGQNGNVNGTGMVAIGNGLSGVAGPSTGAGLAAFGSLTGIYAVATAGTSPSEAIYTLNGGAVVGLNYFNGTQYKVFGNGVVSTIVSDAANQTRVMFAPEAPEVLFEDFGSGQLVNGKTHVAFDPVFAANVLIDASHPLRAFVQVEEECRGVFVTNKSASGFDVVEQGGGTSGAHFSWHVIATRADEEQTAVAKGADGIERAARVSHYSNLRFPVETNHPTAWRAVKARSAAAP